MPRLLLVEDHEEIWDWLARRLSRRGFEVVIASDGAEGVEKASTIAPDLVLMDMDLPILDGWTAASRLKSVAATSGIPIIALTAHAISGDRDKALKAGCDDYHTKPVDLTLLLEQIAALLDRQNPGSPPDPVA